MVNWESVSNVVSSASPISWYCESPSREASSSLAVLGDMEDSLELEPEGSLVGK